MYEIREVDGVIILLKDGVHSIPIDPENIDYCRFVEIENRSDTKVIDAETLAKFPRGRLPTPRMRADM